MIVGIYSVHGAVYYTKAEDLNEVRGMIDNDIPIVIFWNNALGKRYEESILIYIDSMKYLMTESDPIPWEDG